MIQPTLTREVMKSHELYVVFFTIFEAQFVFIFSVF